MERLIENKLIKFPFQRKEYFVTEYKRGELVGQGAHGKVYKARSLKTGDLLAVKIVEKRHLKKNKKFIEAYKKEIVI